MTFRPLLVLACAAVLIAGLGPVVAAALGLVALGYKPSSAAAFSRRTAEATSGGS